MITRAQGSNLPMIVPVVVVVVIVVNIRRESVEESNRNFHRLWIDRISALTSASVLDICEPYWKTVEAIGCREALSFERYVVKSARGFAPR